MTAERDHAALPEAVSSDAALEFVRRVHKQGGAWRLWSTGVLFSFPFGLLIALRVESALATAICGAGTALFVRNLIQNMRATKAGRLLALAQQVTTPVAEIRERTLWIGDATKPRTSWVSLRISANEEARMRESAMPVARLQLKD